MYYAISMRYPLSFQLNWMGFEEFLSYCRENPVDPLLRLILSSDGSMTHMLSALILHPIDLEEPRHDETKAGAEIAGYLGIEADQRVITRDVWLRHGRQKLLYAHSIIPVTQSGKDFWEEIIQKNRPIGYFFGEQGLLTLRDCLSIGLVRCEEMAKDLSLQSDQAFWARRYRLTVNVKFVAVILEVFSPVLFSQKDFSDIGAYSHIEK